jgi:hypothetical protein
VVGRPGALARAGPCAPGAGAARGRGGGSASGMRWCVGSARQPAPPQCSATHTELTVCGPQRAARRHAASAALAGLCGEARAGQRRGGAGQGRGGCAHRRGREAAARRCAHCLRSGGQHASRLVRGEGRGVSTEYEGGRGGVAREHARHAAGGSGRGASPGGRGWWLGTRRGRRANRGARRNARSGRPCRRGAATTCPRGGGNPPPRGSAGRIASTFSAGRAAPSEEGAGAGGRGARGLGRGGSGRTGRVKEACPRPESNWSCDMKSDALQHAHVYTPRERLLAQSPTNARSISPCERHRRASSAVGGRRQFLGEEQFPPARPISQPRMPPRSIPPSQTSDGCRPDGVSPALRPHALAAACSATPTELPVSPVLLVCSL